MVPRGQPDRCLNSLRFTHGCRISDCPHVRNSIIVHFGYRPGPGVFDIMAMRPAIPPRETPGSTAGRMPAATAQGSRIVRIHVPLSAFFAPSRLRVFATSLLVSAFGFLLSAFSLFPVPWSAPSFLPGRGLLALRHITAIPYRLETRNPFSNSLWDEFAG